MTVNNLCNDGFFQPLVLPDGDREITGAYIGDLLSWVMGRAQSGDAWLTIMSNVNVLAVASLADCACVILAEGVTPENEILSTAAQKGINILRCEKSIYEAAIKLSRMI